MNILRANTLKDYSGFILHFGLASAVAAGAFFALGFPPILSALSIGAAAGLHWKLVPYMKKSFQEALNEEKSSILRKEKMREPLRRVERHLGLKRVIPPPIDYKVMSRAESWVRQFARKFGLEKTPELLVMPPNGLNHDEVDTSTLKGTIRHKLLRSFNKHANAFAFSADKDNVVLTDPIVKTLNPSELKGVVAHEVGHLAARHTAFRQIISWVSTPAKILTGLNMLVTAFSSFKNAGLYLLAGALGDVTAKVYARFMDLDPEKPKDKAKIKRFERYFAQASLATMAVALGAPDVLVAQAISFSTRETLDLIEKSNSRRNEFQADRLAAQATNDPATICDALIKIQKHHLKHEKGFNYEPPKFREEKGVLSSFFDRARDLTKTHPNIERRCSRLMGIQLPFYQDGPA